VIEQVKGIQAGPGLTTNLITQQSVGEGLLYLFSHKQTNMKRTKNQESSILVDCCRCYHRECYEREDPYRTLPSTPSHFHYFSPLEQN
jgi:hypothetical protein